MFLVKRNHSLIKDSCMFSMPVDGMGAKDEVPKSFDWRNTEKVIEHNFQNVLLFQRGCSVKKHNYHIIFSSTENLTEIN